MNCMGKYSTLSVRVETATRLRAKMKYGQSIDSFINYLLDQTTSGTALSPETHSSSI